MPDLKRRLERLDRAARLESPAASQVRPHATEKSLWQSQHDDDDVRREQALCALLVSATKLTPRDERVATKFGSARRSGRRSSVGSSTPLTLCDDQLRGAAAVQFSARARAGVASTPTKQPQPDTTSLKETPKTRLFPTPTASPRPAEQPPPATTPQRRPGSGTSSSVLATGASSVGTPGGLFGTKATPKKKEDEAPAAASAKPSTAAATSALLASSSSSSSKWFAPQQSDDAKGSLFGSSFASALTDSGPEIPVERSSTREKAPAAGLFALGAAASRRDEAAATAPAPTAADKQQNAASVAPAPAVSSAAPAPAADPRPLPSFAPATPVAAPRDPAPQTTSAPAPQPASLSLFGSAAEGKSLSRQGSVIGGPSVFGAAAPAPSSDSASAQPATQAAKAIDWRAVLLDYFKKHNPEKAEKVDYYLQKYKGREQDMLATIRKKGYEPPPHLMAPPQAAPAPVPSLFGAAPAPAAAASSPFASAQQQQPTSLFGADAMTVTPRKTEEAKPGSLFGADPPNNDGAMRDDVQQQPFGSGGATAPASGGNFFGAPAGFGAPAAVSSTAFGAAPAAASTFGMAQQQPAPPAFGGGGGGDIRSKVLAIYQQCNPTKLGDVDKILLKYKGQEDKLLQNLQNKYAAQLGGRMPAAAGGIPGAAGGAFGQPAFGAPTPLGGPMGGGSGFGAPSQAQQTSSFAAYSNMSSQFGAPSALGSSAPTQGFGAQQAFGTPQQSSPFGNVAARQPSSMFGAAANTSPFGAAAAPATPAPFGQQQQPQQSPFGGQQSFGGAPAQQASPSLFGGGGGFGQQQAQSGGGFSAFGQQPQQSAGGFGSFGGTPQQQQGGFGAAAGQPSSVFGGAQQAAAPFASPSFTQFRG